MLNCCSYRKEDEKDVTASDVNHNIWSFNASRPSNLSTMKPAVTKFH
jgi:hypothetical protein